MIYSRKLEPVSVDAVRRFAEGAKVSASTDPSGRWRQIKIAWPDVRVTLNIMDRRDEKLAEHLNGFCGYIANVLAAGEMDQRTYHAIKWISNVKHSIGVVADPDFDDDGKCETLIHEIASASRAFIFWEGAILDSNFKLVLGPEREHDPEASHQESDDALARKLRSEKRLKALRVKTLAALPTLSADDETMLRSPQEVVERALAISLVAARAEPDGLDKETALGLVKDWRLGGALSPEERALINARTVDDNARPKFTWRYECSWLLLWALGAVPTLAPASSICNVSDLVKICKELAKKGRDSFRLRPVGEILDEADFIYRLNWAAVDARVNGGSLPDGLDGGVIQERHYVVNWLICLDFLDWDDVTTET